jgi:hypothetical protein
LQNCTEVLKLNSKLVTADDFGAYCLVFPKEYANLGKSLKESFTELSKQYPLAKLVQSKVATPKEFASKIGKLVGESVATKLCGQVDLGDDSVVFLAYGDKRHAVSPVVSEFTA